MPLTIEPTSVHLSTATVQYLKRRIIRGDDPSNPLALKRFPTIVYCLETMWVDPDGVQRERGPEYFLVELDVSHQSKGFLLRFDKTRFVAFLPKQAFLPKESAWNAQGYFIDVVDDEIVIRTH